MLPLEQRRLFLLRDRMSRIAAEPVLYCDDPSAANYKADGWSRGETPAPWTCKFPIVGCPDPRADNFHPLFRWAMFASVMVGEKAICQYGGCTDVQASNYNHSATYNDGTCVYSLMGKCLTRIFFCRLPACA